MKFAAKVVETLPSFAYFARELKPVPEARPPLVSKQPSPLTLNLAWF